jgi:hypothetical protein
MLNQLIKDILTTKDGNSYDNGRVLGTLVVVCFLIFTAVDIYLNRKFDYVNFGIASGTIFAGVGINLKLKENSEPNST